MISYKCLDILARQRSSWLGLVICLGSGYLFGFLVWAWLGCIRINAVGCLGLLLAAISFSYALESREVLLNRDSGISIWRLASSLLLDKLILVSVLNQCSLRIDSGQQLLWLLLDLSQRLDIRLPSLLQLLPSLLGILALVTLSVVVLLLVTVLWIIGLISPIYEKINKLKHKAL